MTSRRDILKNMFKATAAAGSGGLLWGAVAESTVAAPITLRPPGAIEPEQFIKACIKCGKCVEACPYNTLILAMPTENSGVGTPYFKPREIPCYLCTNYPCTDACPSGALDLKKLIKDEQKADINNARMGLAVIHQETCIAYWGIRCDACYRACPLIDEAIELKLEKNKVTGKHANLQPVINSDACTGCGLCEKVCVVEKAAVRVLPRELSTGKVGDHYIKSWEKEDEQRIESIEKASDTDKKDIESALDYLNNDEPLFE